MINNVLKNVYTIEGDDNTRTDYCGYELAAMMNNYFIDHPDEIEDIVLALFMSNEERFHSLWYEKLGAVYDEYQIYIRQVHKERDKHTIFG